MRMRARVLVLRLVVWCVTKCTMHAVILGSKCTMHAEPATQTVSGPPVFLQYYSNGIRSAAWANPSDHEPDSGAVKRTAARQGRPLRAGRSVASAGRSLGREMLGCVLGQDVSISREPRKESGEPWCLWSGHHQNGVRKALLSRQEDPERKLVASRRWAAPLGLGERGES